MLLSKACIYGIRATLYVGMQEAGKYVPISTIAKELDISFHFLTKILQILTQNQIMVSYRGPNGGISLARAGSDIHLIEIIEAIDGRKVFEECILGMPGCGINKPCPLHDQWALTRKPLLTMFTTTTVAELATRVKRDGLRLADVDKLVSGDR